MLFSILRPGLLRLPPGRARPSRFVVAAGVGAGAVAGKRKQLRGALCKDADALLEQMEGHMRAGSSIVPVALNKVIQLKSDGVSFRFLPDSSQVANAIKEPVIPGSFLRARAIGLMPMIDQGEKDDKIITVCADDHEYCHYNDISELSPHRLQEIKRFFEDYKKNENKEVAVDEFLPATTARDAIQDLYAQYILQSLRK